MSDYGDSTYMKGGIFAVKDPDSTEDYAFNWAPYLGEDVIDTCEFLLPDGLTSTQEFNDDNQATIFVSGGTTGSCYRITNRIVTVGGRTLDKTIKIKVCPR